MTSGMASIVTAMEDGDTAEVGVVGDEGIIGSIFLLGPAKISTSAFMQLEGAALRIPLHDLRHAFRTSEEIRDHLLEFVQEQTVSVNQMAGCNRLHESEERLARWLLMAQDRTQSDVLNFTQEFLAMMLGARRTTVTLIAGSLQRAGLIEYSRGRVKILDRENLESAACDCYKIVKDLFANLYSQDSLSTGDHGSAKVIAHSVNGRTYV
jgi:CRP-like cAMP-binding protein